MYASTKGGADFFESAVIRNKDTQNGRVDLGNHNHMELINQMMQELYNSFHGGSNYLEDIFDFSKAYKNFRENKGYEELTGTLRFTSSEGKEIEIKTTLILTPKKFGLKLSRKSQENIFGQETKTRFTRNVGDGTRTNHPFIFRFSDQNRETLAKFHFHFENAQSYSNFVSFMNTGKTKYLFR